MKILALDCATNTGWAIRSGSKVIHGTQVFDLKRGESQGMRWIRFRSWLAEMLRNESFTVIAYEQAHHRGGAATQVGVGFAIHIQTFCAERGIEHTDFHTGMIKKFATGKGNADKSEMIIKARELGYSPKNDNEADAIHILLLAERDLRA